MAPHSATTFAMEGWGMAHTRGGAWHTHMVFLICQLNYFSHIWLHDYEP